VINFIKAPVSPVTDDGACGNLVSFFFPFSTAGQGYSAVR